MKILIVATASPGMEFSVQKIQESFMINDHHETYLCLLGAPANEQIMLPTGFTKVFTLPIVGDALYQMSQYLPPITKVCRDENISMVLFNSTILNHSLGVMLSETLGWNYHTEIKNLKGSHEGYEVTRLVYDSNIEAVFPGSSPMVATIARGNCEKSPELINYETTELGILGKKPEWLVQSKRLRAVEKSSLEDAKILFVAGRGMGSKVNVHRLMDLAKKNRASFGATRTVILNGWAPIESMIGQSGTITSPEVVITFGVSGAAPFMVGIEQAKFIIAINKDTSAAIFSRATHGMVADCVEILTVLEES